MRKIFYLLALVVAGTALLASCKSGSSNNAAAGDTKTDSVALPYKATYSSSFTAPDSAKYVQAVLQSYKDWEDNKLSNAPAYFADTIGIDFSNGNKIKLQRDSAIHVFQKYRDSLSSSVISVIAVTGLRSTDKKEDWVSVWYKQTDTHKSGKIDSVFYNDVNHIKNGKIDYVTSFRQDLKKKM
jgi:hypothetical protein